MHPQNVDSEPENQVRVEEILAEVQALIRGPDPLVDQSVEALRQVMALLDGDSSQGAGELRQRTGELWGLLCEKVVDLDDAQALINEGKQLFVGLPTAQRLTVMNEFVDLGLGVRRALELGPDRSWPAWLEQSDAKDNLEHLLGAFEALDRPGVWPALQVQVEQYRRTFAVDMYGKYLVKLYQDARQEARNRNFAKALYTVETANQLLSGQDPTQLPPDIEQDEILVLRSALVARQQAEVSLWSGAVRLTSSDIPFSEVLSEITLDLPNHPDVPVDDLAALVDDMNQVEKVETVYLSLSDPDLFAEGVFNSKKLMQVTLSIESDFPAFLKETDSQLTNKLRERMLGTLKRIDHLYDDVAVKLAQQIESEIQYVEPDFDPTVLLRNYWQLSWCLVSGLIENPAVAGDVQATLTNTQNILPNLIKQAVQIFERMTADIDLVYINRILDTVRKLNSGLVKNPEVGENHQFLVKLPPLPEGAQFSEIIPKYDDAKLEEWSGIINSWKNRVVQLPVHQQPGKYDVRGMESIAYDVQEILDDLNHVKNNIWPKFDLPGWKEDSSPGRLAGEARLQLSIVSVLQESGRIWQEEKAIDVLIFLDEQLVQGGHLNRLEEHELWILASPRRYLRSRFDDLYPIVIDGVHSQVCNILDDQSRSAQQLLDEILIKPQSVESAEVIYKAIYSNTDLLVREAIKSGNRGEAISLWATVYDATQPWASGKAKVDDYPDFTEVVALVWQKLHRAARSARIKAVVASRKREIAASIAILLLLMVILIGASVLFSRPSEGENQGRKVIVATATMENTLTPNHQASQAVLTASAATELAREGIAQETGAARSGKSTAQAFAHQTATQQTENTWVKTSTAQAFARKTAVSGTALANAATATQSALDTRATVAVQRCEVASGYAIALSSDLAFDPPLGTEHIIGTAPISPSITWEVVNVGGCNWETLEVRPASEEREVSYSLWREGEITTVTPGNPVENNEMVRIIVNFDVLESSNVEGEWVLVVNGLVLSEQSHLEVAEEEWVTLITPPSSRP
jgi:hypothetical protein